MTKKILITNPELLAIILSILVQLPLAIFLGHYFDQRILLQTGYLVSAGLNPYQQHVITVFQSNQHLVGLNPIIGYPPLWPLLMGSIYRLTFNLTPDIYLYNFATKLPIIASNIALAYITRTIMQQSNMSPSKVRFAWLFLLFNPFTLLTTTAWGQFDTAIAVLCVAAVYLLSRGMIVQSSLLLSLSFVLKPISLPMLMLPLLFSTAANRKKNLFHCSIVSAVVLGLFFLPFYIMGWTPPLSGDQVTSFFRLAGGMTLFNLVDVVERSSSMPVGLELLGYLWIPALLLGFYVLYRSSPKSMNQLTEATVVLLLIFFLTRSWLSEQNVNLLFPFLLILLGAGRLNRKLFHLLWIVPLIFLVVNMSVPQLLFLVYPQVIPLKEAFDAQFGLERLALRFGVTIVWHIVALGTLLQLTVRKGYHKV